MTQSPLQTLGFIQPTDHLIKREIIDETSEPLNDLFSLMAPVPDADHRQTIFVGYPVMSTYNPVTGKYTQWVKETWDLDQSSTNQFEAPVDNNFHPVALVQGDREWRKEWYEGQANDRIGYAIDTLISQIDRRREHEEMLFCLQND